ncbi:MAG: hypothetical protein LBT89_05390 [Planctomycetaceae bacterium]|jgi:hypothetical protein|nr:hypothetical protein [Planctomycetaceae bacterium]
MSKPLCIISFIISVLVFLLFVANLTANIPFGESGGILMNLGMIAGSGAVGTFSVLTYLEG